MLTPRQQALRNVGYTGAFDVGGGQGGEGYLNANPNLRDAFNTNLAQLKQYEGGVNPIGFIEPFNQYQIEGITRLAGGAPARGYANMADQALQQQFAGLPQATDIRSLFNTANSAYQNAAAPLTQQSLNAGISMFNNPFQQNVIDELRRQGDISQAGLRSSLAGSRSFGSTSMGQRQAEIDASLLGQIGNLQYQGYNDAISNFMNSRTHGLNAATTGYNLGNSALGALQNAGTAAQGMSQFNQQNFLNNIKNKLTAGGMIQDQNQRVLDVVSPQTRAVTDYGYTNAQRLRELLSGFPSGTPAQSSGGNWLSTLGGLGMIGGGLYNYYNPSIGGNTSGPERGW